MIGPLDRPDAASLDALSIEPERRVVVEGEVVGGECLRLSGAGPVRELNLRPDAGVVDCDSVTIEMVRDLKDRSVYVDGRQVRVWRGRSFSVGEE